MKHFIDQASLNETSIQYLTYKLNEVIRVVNNKPDVHDLEYWSDVLDQFKNDKSINTYTDLIEALKKKPDFNEVRTTVRDELTKFIDEMNQRIYQPTLDQLLKIIGDALNQYIREQVDKRLNESIEDLKNRFSAELIYWN